MRADDPSRTTLGKAADENFPVAPFFLPRDWRDDLMAVYGYARLVDDIGDGDLAPGGADAFGLAPDAGPLPLLDALEEDLHRVFDGTPRHPLLRGLQPTVRRRGLTPGPFLGLIQANRQDQLVRRYETYDDLLAYCELSANPVGRLVLGITGTATPERIRRSDEICTALQLVEHLQDVAEDLARDRIYLPAEDLKSFHVTEEELARPSAGAAVRSLVAFQAERARALMHAGLPLVGSVHGRLRLLLAGFAGGGLAALDAIAAAGFDVLSGPPKPTKPSLTRQAGAVLLRARREGGT
ncbi:phytoene synthase [Streptomyces hydrogenans]|uniref:Phytoene synthase n=1 Tax=Streptomyces hydrogenans TaxID=1873719 RepID=A0ABQ3PNN7_9ACTN|nr:phytoene synthase [Streptomyces hydrogenans]GHI26639.1 phytoene synthase [Streptomyces hydrogenans]